MHLSVSQGDLCSNLVSLWALLWNFPKLSMLCSFFPHSIISVKFNSVVSSCDSQKRKEKSFKILSIKAHVSQVISSRAWRRAISVLNNQKCDI